MGEHGPHALALGPDGLIYIVVGNFSQPEKDVESSSPYHHYYEGDLLQPRYEDASGHAVGIKAPGGSILRTDTGGTAVELVAGGLQNPYDLAFNRDGELFTADSDMEWDLGMPWYRPTRRQPRRAGGRVRLAQRLGQMARLLLRQPAARWSKWAAARRPASKSTTTTCFRSAITTRCSFAIGRADASWSIKPKQHGATYKAVGRSLPRRTTAERHRHSRSGPTAGSTSAPAAATPKGVSTAWFGRAKSRPR